MMKNKECNGRSWLKELILGSFDSITDFAKEIEVRPRVVWYWIEGERNPSQSNKSAIISELGDAARRAFINEDYPTPKTQEALADA
jgi:hypothetical protein